MLLASKVIWPAWASAKIAIVIDADLVGSSFDVAVTTTDVSLVTSPTTLNTLLESIATIPSLLTLHTTDVSAAFWTKTSSCNSSSALIALLLAST